MSHHAPASTATRRTRSPLRATLVVVGATLVAVLGYQVMATSSSQADGRVTGDVTVFDDAVPAIANLDPDLAGALRRAATDAASDGVTLHVTSGWRSRDHQEQLLREAISTYGSAEEAARWVAPPATSSHVSGDAIDIGPSAALTWLAEHGAAYGLCQVYANEPWHYELRPDAVEHGCPATYADAAHDPRMQQ